MKLNFTGNWFIDLGILGFVNLMEEVYGWDLEELENQLNKEFEKIVFVYFPLGYLFFHSKVSASKKEIANIKKKIKEKTEDLSMLYKKLSDQSQNKETEKIKKKIVKIKQKMTELEEELSNKESHLLQSKYDFIKNLKEAISTKISNLEDFNFENLISDFKLIPPPYNRNFYLFNSKKMKTSLKKSSSYLTLLLKEDVRKLLKIKSKKLSYEIYPDSTINPFLFSQTEFPNISCTLPHSIEKIKYLISIGMPLYLLLLTFYNAFSFVYGRSIVFYTNNLKISYSINKKLKLLTDKSSKQGSLFKITWMAILDQLIEKKAEFNLEHLYLIEYFGISNQKLVDVEYIGIPKLQATFLLDDKIRDKLNNLIIINATEQRIIDSRWLIEEFIKNKPLLPIFYRNLRLYFNQRINSVATKSLIYSAALDKVITKLGVEKTSVFADDFFNKNSLALEEVKDTIQRYFSLMFITKELFSQESVDDRKSLLAYRLFSRLGRNQKYPFVNELLKELNGKDSQGVESLIKHTFENILANDKTWQSEAIPILAGLIGGG